MRIQISQLCLTTTNLMYSRGYTCIRSSPLNIVVKFVCAFWQTDIFIDLCMSSTQICMRCAAEPIFFFYISTGNTHDVFCVYICPPLDKK